MQNKHKTITVSVIGTGMRSRAVVQQLLKAGNSHIIIKAVFDPDQHLAETTCRQWGFPQAAICTSHEEAVQRHDIDWVLIFSPNAYHKDHILCAFDAGKHVFTEKPLATSIEDCKTIFEAHEQHSHLLFATGFVLRYAPLYRKVKELLDSGFIGNIISIDANENIAPDHGAYIMKNWRRFKHIAGPHILEKCVHDLDLLNWFTQSVPSRIASFGGRDFFTPDNQHYYDTVTTPAGQRIFEGWHDPHSQESPFTSEKDLMDNQVAILEYRNRIRVTFQATMSNAIPERRMYFSGTEGTLIAELYSGIIKTKRIDQDEMKLFDFSGGDGHGGGDRIIAQELFESMTTGKPPKCSGNEGLESAVVALAIEEAKDQGRVYNLEPVWNHLKR